MSGLAWILVALGAALAAIEWWRADRANRGLRIVLGALALIALALLARLATPQEAGAAAATDPGPLTALDLPDEVGLGEPIPVRGRATVPDSGWVILEGPDGNRDSAVVNAATPWFQLAARSRAAGGAVYRLSLRAASGEVFADSFGISVRPDRPPTLLVLDGSPSFETAYLKRWLAARGGRLTVRTTFTRGRDRIERLNGAPAADGPLTPAMLGGFDAVLADSAALSALSPAERRALTDAIEADGLGLLLTSGTPSTITLAVFAVLAVDSPGGGAADEARTARLTWPHIPRRSRTGIEVAGTILRPRPGLAPLITDHAGGWLAARRNAGAGRVAVTLVRTPSRWALEGEQDLFAGYWDRLISAVARDTATRASIEGGAAPRVDHRAAVTLIATARPEAVSVAAPDGTLEPIALARDPVETRRWTGAYWPRQAGWHALRFGAREVPFLVLEPPPGAEGGRGVPTAPPTDWRLQVAIFSLLIGALSGLWLESRRRLGK
ncbi:MAG: hypothetical protein SF070_11515 [Gemmatimonadota bacterium]|nr:hypothetical protein [Gemmatimonadota bacterium]